MRPPTRPPTKPRIKRNHGHLILSPRLWSGSQPGSPEGFLSTATAQRTGRSGRPPAGSTADRTRSLPVAHRPRTAHVEASETAHAGGGR